MNGCYHWLNKAENWWGLSEFSVLLVRFVNVNDDGDGDGDAFDENDDIVFK